VLTPELRCPATSSDCRARAGRRDTDLARSLSATRTLLRAQSKPQCNIHCSAQSCIREEEVGLRTHIDVSLAVEHYLVVYRVITCTNPIFKQINL
jgi:hypothetical protein